MRWLIEVTFAEVRRHLGFETQRQWAAKAIARTTPVLLALFSLVCLMVYRRRDRWASLPRSTAWYLKPQATFSDCLALVRRTIWAEENDVNSLADSDRVVISRPHWERVLAQLASTACAASRGVPASGAGPRSGFDGLAWGAPRVRRADPGPAVADHGWHDDRVAGNGQSRVRAT